MNALDKLIADAQTTLKNTEEGSGERATAQAKLDALTSVKEAGIGFTQADLNHRDKQAKADVQRDYDAYKARVEQATGSSFEEFEEVLASLAASLPEDEGEGDEQGDVLNKLQEQIKAANDSNTALSRSLYSERAENNLRRALSSVEVGEGEDKRKVVLKEGRFDAIRGLAGEAGLVEKLMNDESLDADAYAHAAASVYQMVPEVFDSKGETEHQERPASRFGVDRGPEIPPTATPSDSRQRSATESYKDAKYAERKAG